MVNDLTEDGVRFGRYTLIKKIAEGGMGELFLARHRGIGSVSRIVVLKRLLPSINDNAEFVGHFLTEARIGARLCHANVAQLYEVGCVDGVYFLAMENVRGSDLLSLHRRLRAVGAIWPQEVIFEIAQQAASGLRHVHELADFAGKPLNVVHRDVSPSNLMISNDGFVKVLDFGVAKVSETIDASDRFFGKPGYIAPEICRGGDVDHRADLFSLGVVLWELFTQRRLFRRPTIAETMQAALTDDAPAPSTLRPGLAASTDAIISKLLARDRQHRLHSCAQLIEELDGEVTSLGLRRGPRLLAGFMNSVSRGKTGGLAETREPSGAVRRRVLIVDDEAENVELLQRALRGTYHTVGCTDSNRAVAIIRQEKIDLLISDQRMPGVDGLELLEAVRVHQPTVPKIICSAYQDPRVILQAINHTGIDHYILKPCRPQQVLDAVNEVMRNAYGHDVWSDVTPTLDAGDDADEDVGHRREDD